MCLVCIEFEEEFKVLWWITCSTVRVIQLLEHLQEVTNQVLAYMFWYMQVEKALQSSVKQDLLKGIKACKLDFWEICIMRKQTNDES